MINKLSTNEVKILMIPYDIACLENNVNQPLKDLAIKKESSCNDS
jgi:hypothetical protein